MYQSSKRGLQLLLWTDLLKGSLLKFLNSVHQKCLFIFLGGLIASGWLLREPTTINYPFEKGPLSPVSRFPAKYFVY